jgi:hypothetical protein
MLKRLFLIMVLLFANIIFAQDVLNEHIAKEFKHRGIKYQIYNLTRESQDATFPYYNQVVARFNGKEKILSNTLSNHMQTGTVRETWDDYFYILENKANQTKLIGRVSRMFRAGPNNIQSNSQIMLIELTNMQPLTKSILDRKIAKKLLKTCNFDLPDTIGFSANILEDSDDLQQYQIITSWPPYRSWKDEAKFYYDVKKDFLYLSKCPQY